ncbi:MAG: hypothetical protein NT055_03710 [Nitrospirae bacterium]|nr:hypothetical protein [Nitrospirota bacterium]
MGKNEPQYSCEILDVIFARTTVGQTGSNACNSFGSEMMQSIVNEAGSQAFTGRACHAFLLKTRKEAV